VADTVANIGLHLLHADLAPSHGCLQVAHEPVKLQVLCNPPLRIRLLFWRLYTPKLAAAAFVVISRWGCVSAQPTRKEG